MATGIIQVNREAKDKEAKKFIKGSSKGHSGTHQVVAKIRFPLGQNFDAQTLASDIETTGGASSGLGGGSGTSATMTDADGREYYIDAQGNSQWVVQETATAASGWQWDGVRQSNYYMSGNRRVYQDEATARANTTWQWDPYVQQQCMWFNGVYIGPEGTSV